MFVTRACVGKLVPASTDLEEHHGAREDRAVEERPDFVPGVSFRVRFRGRFG